MCSVVAPLESPGTSLQVRDVSVHRNETSVVWGRKATSFHLTVCFALVADDNELSLVLLVAFIWFFVRNQYGTDSLS